MAHNDRDLVVCELHVT